MVLFQAITTKSPFDEIVKRLVLTKINPSPFLLITFYLANQVEVEAYLRQEEADFNSMQQKLRARDPVFYQKLAEARRQRPAVRP